MKHRLTKILAALSLVLSILPALGCASHRIPDHTRLYTRDPQMNIWSYKSVAGEGHVTRILSPGERVVLEGGAIITFDGQRVAVNNEPINSSNAVIERDGTIVPGAFIPTFK